MEKKEMEKKEEPKELKLERFEPVEVRRLYGRKVEERGRP